MEQASKSLHPLVGAAAISVIVLSAAGVAAITGVLPRSTATQQNVSTQAAAELNAATTSGAVAVPAQEAPGRKVVVKSVEKHASPRREAPVARNEPPATPAPVVPQAPATPLPPPPSAAPQPAAPVVAEAPRPVQCIDCGIVENFREVQVKGEGSGLGAIAGGVGGLILGNQVGRGTGKDIATIAGAVGGAFAGHEIEKRTRTKKQYEVSVRMDDGSVRTVTLDAPPVWRAGERVRVQDGQIRAI